MSNSISKPENFSITRYADSWKMSPCLLHETKKAWNALNETYLYKSRIRTGKSLSRLRLKQQRFRQRTAVGIDKMRWTLLQLGWLRLARRLNVLVFALVILRNHRFEPERVRKREQKENFSEISICTLHYRATTTMHPLYWIRHTFLVAVYSWLS